jgi:hypothetical protein
MKRIIVLSAILYSTLCFTQSEYNSVRDNGVYVEGYLTGDHTGSVGWFSVNYNRKLGASKIPCLRVGMSADFESSIGVPVVMTFLTNPNGKSHFEGGIGVNSRLEFYQGNFSYTPFGMIPLMYRYEANNGFLLRAGINYFFYSYAIWFPVGLQLGVSFGYSF